MQLLCWGTNDNRWTVAAPCSWVKRGTVGYPQREAADISKLEFAAAQSGSVRAAKVLCTLPGRVGDRGRQGLNKCV